jgi:hypothetical protein
MFASKQSGRRWQGLVWLSLAFALPAAGCGTNLGGLPVVDGDPLPPSMMGLDAGTRPPNMVSSPDAGVPVDSPPPDPTVPDAGAPADGPVSCPATTLQTDPGCSFGYHPLRRATPEVVLVFDRTSAMSKTVAGSTQTRWVEMVAAVEDNLNRTHAGVRWGLKLFPTNAVPLCNVTEGLDVPIGVSNLGPITTSIRGRTPLTGPEGSPLDLGIKKAAAALRLVPSPNPRYLVLATDGIPNCPAGLPGETEAVKAVAMQEQMGLRTFVIGTATPASPQHRTLNDLAVAGGEGRPGDQRYYQALSKPEMQQALDEITGRLLSCVLTVDALTPAPDYVALNIGNTRIPRDQARREGWNWGGAPILHTVHVYGSYCTQLMNDPVATAELVFGCEGHPPPPPPPCAGP